MIQVPALMVLENEGSPIARIPDHQVWELVEYLSFQRIRVSYSYDGGAFTVLFLQANCDAARKILEAWMNSRAMADSLEVA